LGGDSFCTPFLVGNKKRRAHSRQEEPSKTTKKQGGRTLVSTLKIKLPRYRHSGAIRERGYDEELHVDGVRRL
jgi:hypothetical protein